MKRSVFPKLVDLAARERMTAFRAMEACAELVRDYASLFPSSDQQQMCSQIASAIQRRALLWYGEGTHREAAIERLVAHAEDLDRQDFRQAAE